MRGFDIAAREFAGFDVCQELDGVVGRWMDAMGSRPDEELLLRELRRRMSLDFFDYDTYLSCDLHPHNLIYLQTEVDVY